MTCLARILDGIHRIAPSSDTVSTHIRVGMGKGMAYSGIFMTILYTLSMVLNAPVSQAILAGAPILIGILVGAAVFPFLKTIIETFDGSQPFFDRLRYSYRQATLYARGAVAGFGFAYLFSQGLFHQEMPDRITFGLMVGLVASAGVIAEARAL